MNALRSIIDFIQNKNAKQHIFLKYDKLSCILSEYAN